MPSPKIHPHVCPGCKKNFIGTLHQKFCSHKCAIAGSARERGKRGHEAAAGNRRVAALAAKAAREHRRAFFAKRDAEYERNFPGMQFGDVRGRIAAGGHCGVIRACDNGAIVRRYIAATHES